MNRMQMMSSIAATLAEGQSIEIHCTEARGRTLVQHYAVTRHGVKPRPKWSGYGNCARPIAPE